MATDDKPFDAQALAPSAPAAKPSKQVPDPRPAPTERVAPHLAAGVVDEIRTHGSAVDPFTGKTLTADDLA